MLYASKDTLIELLNSCINRKFIPYKRLIGYHTSFNKDQNKTNNEDFKISNYSA